MLKTWAPALRGCAVALLLACLVAVTVAQPRVGGAPTVSVPVMDKIRVRLQQKKDLLKDLKGQLELNYFNFMNATQAERNSWFSITSKDFGTSRKSINACGDGLPSELNPTCDRFLGDTPSCECNGKKRVEKVTVKPLDADKAPNSIRNAANVAAFAAGESMTAKYKRTAAMQDYENKLMYFGSVDGVLAMYPGVLWPSTRDTTYGGTYTCGKTYDPRYRPWFLTGSNGPKNVIFILDTSGSTKMYSRLELIKAAATQLVDSMTMADYMGIVQFNTDAKAFNNLDFLAPATAGFRDMAKKYINGMISEGQTNYADAFRQAFKMADNSYNQFYESGCQTAYVFLTDGEQTAGDKDYVAMVKDRKMKLASKKKEMFIIIGFGDDVKPTSDPGKALKNLACATEGIFESVPDVPTSGSAMTIARDKFKIESKIMNALGAFSRYFQTSAALQKREAIAFTEIYEGASFPMFMTTASQAVYDKSDPNRWKFLGVVGIDVVTCELEKAMYAEAPQINDKPPWPMDTRFPNCKCAKDYTYKNAKGVVEKYSSTCTTSDWANPWCATVNCGLKSTGVSTGYWADCKPYGTRAELENEIIKSGEECINTLMDACEIEALRPMEYRCDADPVTKPLMLNPLPASCTAEVLANKTAANVQQIPGFPADGKDSDASAESKWAANPASEQAYTDTTHAKWSSDTSQCDQCKNTEMRPQCALPKKCGPTIPPSSFMGRSTAAKLGPLSVLSMCLLGIVTAYGVGF